MSDEKKASAAKYIKDLKAKAEALTAKRAKLASDFRQKDADLMKEQQALKTELGEMGVTIAVERSPKTCGTCRKAGHTARTHDRAVAGASTQQAEAQ